MTNALDRLVPQPGGAPSILTSYVYDLAGRTTQVSDNLGHILAYAFDTAKRPSSATQTAPGVAGTRTVSYQRDAAGNKTRATWADGYYVQYAFDALGRMTTASENGTFLLATYIYDPLSRRTSLVYGNGATTGTTYTTQGDLLTLASTLSGASNTYTNTFTKAHQLASETASNAAWQHVPAVFQTTAYSAANSLNQYVNVTVGANPAATMAYDANGNLTGDGVWTFAFDAENRLKTAAKSGTSASYAYDPLGRRQAKTVGAVLTTFLSDGDEEIAEYDAGATLLRRYVPGPGTDQPIAMVTPSGGSNTRSYFHVNRQGSTIAMSADNATVSEGPYTYDAYGNGAPATGVPFKYTGRRLDPETGLYYYRARYYSPSLGRFLQIDPVGYKDQMNLYAYVANDPVNSTDANGKWAISITFGGEITFGPVGRNKSEGVFFSTHDENGDFNPTIGTTKSEGPSTGGRGDVSVNVSVFGGDKGMSNMQGEATTVTVDGGPASVTAIGSGPTSDSKPIGNVTGGSVGVGPTAPPGGSVSVTRTKVTSKVSASDAVGVAAKGLKSAAKAGLSSVKKQVVPNGLPCSPKKC